MAEIYANIVVYFLKYILAYLLLFTVVPCFIFTNIKSDMIKSVVSNYVKMTF